MIHGNGTTFLLLALAVGVGVGIQISMPLVLSVSSCGSVFVLLGVVGLGEFSRGFSCVGL